MRKKRTGEIVKTKTGLIGKVYYEQEKVNRKVVVHVDGHELPFLCDPLTLERIEYFYDTNE